ncbi:TetR/AcrR family transcriptional regulator [Amycolatopsis sp. CA-126428]|uniref:TetR/AcrR family transcriptional regulator n=1 Tax=Amycolatopsis sp. CA-126428 TaxID=2073158 RepID=UPI001304DDA2|nr:TetR/AcrR family transcriptional regulator [Amycolatopsis sp. CA-126428]
MPRPDPRLARTRAVALEAAYDVLIERGFGNATMDEVSARSGVAKSTLYRHWSTRDDLLREAFSAHALAGAPPGTDLATALCGYIHAYAEGLSSNWGRAAASLAVAALDDPEQRQAQQGFVATYRADLHGFVRAAVARGEIPQPDEANVSRVFDRLIAVLFYRFLFIDEPLDEKFIEQEVQHALQHLCPSSGDSPGTALDDHSAIDHSR